MLGPPPNVVCVGLEDTSTLRVTAAVLVFGATEKPTVAGNVLPVAPDVIVTPSPGNVWYVQPVPEVFTVNVPAPPFAGIRAGVVAENVNTHVFTGCLRMSCCPPKTKISSRGDAPRLGETKLIEIVVGPVPALGPTPPIHGGVSPTIRPTGVNQPSYLHSHVVDDVKSVAMGLGCAMPSPAAGIMTVDGLNPVTQPGWAITGLLAQQIESDSHNGCDRNTHGTHSPHPPHSREPFSRSTSTLARS